MSETSAPARPSHGLAWLTALCPAVGIALYLTAVAIYPGAFRDEDASSIIWARGIALFAVNSLLIIWDQHTLTRAGADTALISGAAQWLVPVYLFQRARLIGGGYGYAVLWLALFAAYLVV